MPGPTAGNIHPPPPFPSELVLPRQIFVRALLLPGDLAWYFLGDPVSSCPSSPLLGQSTRVLGGTAEMQRGEESQQSGGSCSVTAVLSQDTVPTQGGFPSAVAEGELP